MSNKSIYERITELMDAGGEFAVAQIISDKGSCPAKSGSKMIVFPNGKSEHTVGGGYLEKYTIKKSINAIKTGKNQFFNLDISAEEGKMSCGGHVSVFIEVFKAGHKIELVIKGQVAPWEGKEYFRDVFWHLPRRTETVHTVHHTPEYPSYFLLPVIPK